MKNMKKKNLNVWLLAAILFCSLSFTVVSCSDDDSATIPGGTTEFFSTDVNRLIDENYAEVKQKGYAKLVIPASMYSKAMFKFPANATSDIEAMVKAGYKVYVNGGTVRDAIMGKEAHDVDFTTDADIIKIKDVLPHAESFNAFRDIWVAKAYHGDELETDIAPMFSIFPELSGKADVPVTKFPNSPYCTDLLEDTYSRDFTFNAMYYDYATGDIIDYHGGLHDLREGIVRTVFNADLSVSQDARKFFRASRFAAKYDFKMDSELDQALKNHWDVLKEIDVNNAVYQTVSGFDGGFAKRFFKLIDYYKVTDFLYTSMKDYLHTPAYDDFVLGMLDAFDKEGKADMALSYAAIFWPRFAAESAANKQLSVSDILNAIDQDNAAALRFEKVSYGDYSYVLPFINDVWTLQQLMTSDSYRSSEVISKVKENSHYAEALRFLKARATMDSTLQSYADFWSNPQSASASFFSDEVNKLIDENYPLVMQNGYAELVIPASMYDPSLVQFPQYHKDVMAAMNKLGFKTYVNGGAVRDCVLGTSVHDVDFSTNATPQQVKEQLTSYEVRVSTTGGGDIAQALHDNGDWTDIVPIKGVDSRLEGKKGIPLDAAFGQTYSNSLLDDSYSRDLTINAVYYDFQTGNIIDYHGGLHDLREHIIRTVYDANIMFPINPSALLRTVRFAARYGFDIDQETTRAITDHMHYCNELGTGLANFYVTKGFTDGCGSRTYQYYLKYGILDHFALMLKDYLRKKNYEGPLTAALDYLDEQKNKKISLAIAAIFLPCIEDNLGTQEPTLENITALWDKLESESGQKAIFELDDYSGTKTETMTIWYLYKQMTDDATLADANKVQTIKANALYNQAKLLLNGYAKGDSSLSKFATFWN